MKTTLMLFCALLVAGCITKGRIVDKQDLGMVRSVQIFGGAFGHPETTTVICDSMAIVLWHNHNIRLQRRAYICTDDNGNRWFKLDGSDELYSIKGEVKP